jgi:hypothetical protein
MFPSTVKVTKLNAQQPEYASLRGAYDDFSTLYEGGKAIRDRVTQFLRKRPKELSDVYTVRQQNFSYTNLLGNIVGWYEAAVFKQAPQIVKKQAGAKGDAALKIPGEVETFCAAFEKDCDQGGTSFVDFWPQVLESLLLYRSAYVLVDLPGASDDAPLSLGAQVRTGRLNPFLAAYDPTSVVNWECDARGNLEWAVLYMRCVEQKILDHAKQVDYWYIFDRQQVALYEREVRSDENRTPEDATATLAAGYPRPHALADQNRVPLRKITVPKGLWLANRVYLPLLNHLNLDNSLDFGLFQSNLAQLVIEDGTMGNYEDKPASGAPVSSEVGYHHLPNGGKMYYLEPEGRSYAASQTRIDNLEERIYKACYLQDQARTNSSTPTAQSGISKAMDKTPSRDAMCALGDLIRGAMQAVYQDALSVRGFTEIEADIRGLDFSDKASAEDLDLLERGQAIPVNSKTFEREVGKKTARVTLPDMNPDTLRVIDAEIDANPTPSEQQAAQEAQQRQDMIAKFSQSFSDAGAVQ